MPRFVCSRPVPVIWLGGLIFAANAASALTVDWVEVGSPGNDCDSQLEGCFGDVATPYQIARTEVTNAQYAEFLNAVADADPNGLYNPSMAWAGSGFGGINRTGSAGTYIYTAASSRENMPVNYVSFYDVLRFANWMSNGQPTGAQGNDTTETGSYTITSTGITNNTIAREHGASVVLPSEHEWYKAAYYHPATSTYFDYPTGTNTETVCADVTAAANRANCGNAVGSGSGGLTPVGSYTGSPSPYGTFDQGGNLWEWNEAIPEGGSRGLRGGAFHQRRVNPATLNLPAPAQSLDDPSSEANHIGFRIARLPEPGQGGLIAAGLLLIALRRKPRAASALAAFAAILALPLAGSAADDLIASARGGNSMWDYCYGKPDGAPVPADPRSLVHPGMNVDKAVHFNVRWRNCHFDPEAVQEAGNAETCGELRQRHERGDLLLDPGGLGPGGFSTGTHPSDATFTAEQFNRLWEVWGYQSRPANFDELVGERYGSAFSGGPNPYPRPGEDPNQTNGGSGTMPEMLTQVRNGQFGTWSGEITFTCHTCHSGAVGVPGGPGPGALWGGGSTLADLNLLFRDMLALGWESSPLIVLNLNRTRGRSNASIVNIAFATTTQGDPESLIGVLTSGSTADMDAPAWWNMGHRPLKFVDGIFAMDTPRVDAVFYSPELSSQPSGAAWMRENGPDLNVWVESQKSPAYPYPIDTALAEQGARLFHELDLWGPSRVAQQTVPRPPASNGSCAGCHGAYAPRYVNDPAYLDSPDLAGMAGYVVPLEIIGTDPVRVEANNEGIQESGRNSFFGYPETRGTAHDCGPQGHPDLNDGRAPGYLAPALYGIWATAPYLHNGAVPNVWEVLQPSERKQIWRRRTKPQIALPPPDEAAHVLMGYDFDVDRAYDRQKLGWSYDEIPCQVESATNPSVSPYVNCNPSSEDQQDPIVEQVLGQLYSGVFLGWNLISVPPLTPVQLEDRKIFNTKMFAQGNEGHEFTAVLTDAERLALIEYLKTL